MKNTKRNSRPDPTPSTQQLRTAALRALNGGALKVVKGGVESPPSSDPIC